MLMVVRWVGVRMEGAITLHPSHTSGALTQGIALLLSLLNTTRASEKMQATSSHMAMVVMVVMMMMMVLVASGSPTLQASPAVLTPADRSVTLKWSGMNSLPSYSLLILFLLWSYAFLSHLTSSLENRLTDPLSTLVCITCLSLLPFSLLFCSRSQAGQDARYYHSVILVLCALVLLSSCPLVFLSSCTFSSLLLFFSSLIITRGWL